MSEQTLLQLNKEQKYMTRMATRMVLCTALFIHVLLNIYAYLTPDEFIKTEIPIASGVTVLAVIISFRLFKKH